MIYQEAKWEKLGQIAKPNPSIFWMSTFTGPSFAVQNGDSSFFDIFITGRDEKNRSIVGKSTLDLGNIGNGLSIQPNPIFTPGELGAFDENGVSYPIILEHEGQRYMYYVGWMPSVLTPFQNFPGLAMAPIGSDDFKRFSRAPIMQRTNEEPFCVGSVYVMKDEGQWKMWYTSFLRWGQPGEHKHYYVIKCAFSKDGINWERPGNICINIEDPGEYAIGKPSVIKHNGIYHMWYVYRGLEYRIGYAHSTDGIRFTRADHLAGIDVSPEGGWDGRAISYPHVFRYKDYLYMLYCGNEYGREGLGIAKLYLPE